MNALLGQEAKTNRALCGFRRNKGTGDGCRKDGGEFRRAGGGSHSGGGWQFDGRHGGSGQCNCPPSWAGTSERDGNAGQLESCKNKIAR
jgi:hypothetical protein